jgi:hypothetical protein
LQSTFVVLVLVVAVVVITADQRVDTREWLSWASILSHVRVREGCDVVRGAHHGEVARCRHRRASVIWECRGLGSWCDAMRGVAVAAELHSPWKVVVRERSHARVGGGLKAGHARVFDCCE